MMLNSVRASGFQSLPPVIALIFVLVCAGACTEEPVALACSETLRQIQAGVSSLAEPWTFVLTVDTDKKIVTVEKYEPVPIAGDASKTTVVFMASPATNIYGVSSGTLNRLTGAASIHIIDDGLRIIDGICKPAQKLF
jgi:hypothetical protein